jgi:hypothetical protein
MIGGWRVVVVTPAGRRRYLEILLPYILRERRWLDEYQVWLNTEDETDIEYVGDIAAEHGGFVRLLRGSHVPDGARTVREFYPAATDTRTIYIKLDDDICFVADGALRKLTEFRARHTNYFLVHANTVNSPFASCIHQRLGALDTSAGVVDGDPLSPIGWKSGRFAAAAHAQFLAAVDADDVDRFRFGPWPLTLGARCSINCCAWLGRDFADFGGVIGNADDEYWLTVTKSTALGRPSCILGTAIVAHFAYGPQRHYLERWTDLLDRYLALSRRLIMHGAYSSASL